jgi:hypothetical protein
VADIVKMGVSTLVSQMYQTLSTIHSTLASLDTTSHDARLPELQRQRDSALSTLHNAAKDVTEKSLQAPSAFVQEQPD